MKRTAIILMISTFLIISVLAGWAQVRKQTQPAMKVERPSPEAQLLSIQKVRGPQMMTFFNKQITIEGFYYDGSIPMVIDDIKRVYVDTPLPPDSYVPIVGPKPAGLKSGDKISLTGMLLKPTPQDHPSVQREPVILRIERLEQLKILKPSSISFRPFPEFRPYQPPVDLPDRYAVLIAGGWNPANNHIRYWNDLKTMYNILRSNGYAAQRIYVIYADGVPRDSSMPVHYSATPASIATVFNTLSRSMSDNDTLYIMLNDHGSPNALCLWYVNMSNTDFGNEVNKVSRYSQMVIQMKQCHSGSFIPPLTGARRTVMSSCASNQLSYGHPSNQFGEFTYWYFSALTGRKPDGSGNVNADSNNNGKISILEAYNFARSHDQAPETPHFEDDGAAPARTGQVPSGTDGNRSASIYLTGIEAAAGAGGAGRTGPPKRMK
ncbi:MAG: C13 family peptidase [Thermodesulfobacteriota bacterium]